MDDVEVNFDEIYKMNRTNNGKMTQKLLDDSDNNCCYNTCNSLYQCFCFFLI